MTKKQKLYVIYQGIEDPCEKAHIDGIPVLVTKEGMAFPDTEEGNNNIGFKKIRTWEGKKAWRAVVFLDKEKISGAYAYKDDYHIIEK